MGARIPRNQIRVPTARRRPGASAPADVRMTDAAREAWEKARELARERIDPSAWRLWIEPVRLLGERQGAICVEAPARIATWVRRRYGSWLGDAIRQVSDMRGLHVYAAEPDPGEDDPCL